MSSHPKYPGDIRIISSNEESVSPSLDFVESPVMRKGTFETLEFPTEETLQLRSANSPRTADSSLPLSRDTFYGRVKESIWGNRLRDKLKLLNSEKGRNQTANESKARETERFRDSESLRITELIQAENKEEEVVGRRNTEPYELNTLGDEEENRGREIPTLMWCAYCGGEIKTQVAFVNSSKTFWAALGIFMAGGVAGCFLLPYMTNQCKEPRVTCSRCQHVLH